MGYPKDDIVYVSTSSLVSAARDVSPDPLKWPPERRERNTFVQPLEKIL
jgi:hypothetical protein